MAALYDDYLSLPILALSAYAFLEGIGSIRSSIERRFRYLLSLGFGCWLIGIVSRLVFVSYQATAVDLVIDLLYLSYYVCFLYALDQKPHLGSTSTDEHPLRSYAKAGTAFFSGGLLVYFLVIPVNLSPSTYQTWLPSYALWMSLDLVLVARLSGLAWKCRDQWCQLYAALWLAMTLVLITDVLEGLSQAEFFSYPSGTALDFLWYLPLAAVLLGSRVRNVPVPDGLEGPPGKMPERWFARPGRLPIALMGYGFAFLSIHVVGYGFEQLDASLWLPRTVVLFLVLPSLVVLAVREQVMLERWNRQLQDEVNLERSRHGQKIEALGRLAGGVAHDFNNLLQVIQGHAELLGGSLQDARERESADAIFAASKRAASLTRQLLAFSRRQLLQPISVDLNQTVHGMEEMLGRLLGEQIELVGRRSEPVQIPTSSSR